jgi:putative transposase
MAGRRDDRRRPSLADCLGVVRGRRHRTTIPGKVARRAPDLLGRDFTAAAPNRKWVTDFTYTRTWSGFVYVAFVVYCYSRGIWAGTRPP